MNIALYLSRSNGEVSRVIDLPKLAASFKELPVVKIFDDFFDPSAKDRIRNDIASKKLDGIVLAGESPLYYKINRGADSVLKEIESSGINLNRVGFANIKEQVALPHKKNPKGALLKAKTLIDVAIEKIKHSVPLESIEFPPNKRVAVIGAGLEGITAAERLLEHGNKVFLIDREKRLRLNEEETSAMRAPISYVLGHPNLTMLSSTTIEEVTGHQGDFKLHVKTGSKTDCLAVGAIIIAVGADTAYTGELRSVFYIDIDSKGYFKPLNDTTLATMTQRPGIFMVPIAKNHAVKTAFADSAALSAISMLDEPELVFRVLVSQVDEKLCGGCGTCIKTCMFKASSMDEKRRLATVDASRCRGCGNCVTSCPTGARDLLTNPTKYLHEAIDILSQLPSNGSPSVLFLLCDGCGYPSLDIAGLSGAEYPVNVLPLGVGCGARVDTQLILEAFARGIDGVLIGKCKEDRCENLVGSVDLDRRANLFREILRSRGINSERLRITGFEGCETGEAAAEAATFLKELKKMEAFV